jgi:hypothetical protein
MPPTKDDIKTWLKNHGHSREWLGEQCGTPGKPIAKRTVDNWLSSQQEIPGGTLALISRLMEDDEREQAAKQEPNLDRFTIECEAEEFDAFNAAANKRDMLVRAWALEVLKEAAKRDQNPANIARHPSAADNILAFPEIPLFHAAAGLPVAADGDIYAPTRELGPGRIACQLHGESMAPRFPDGSTVILRARDSLRNPQLKKGEIYLFDRAGEKTLKVYNTRKATTAEIKAGLSYPSADGTPKVRVLRSLNPAFPEIVATEPIHWLGWLDKDDNP